MEISVEELLSCKVCMDKYTDNDKKPLFLSCGHTFCSQCLRLMYKRQSVKCPLDKKESKYENFQAIPTNFSVLNCLHSNEQNDVSNGAASLKFTGKKCPSHESETLKFYCQTHDAIIC